MFNNDLNNYLTNDVITKISNYLQIDDQVSFSQVNKNIYNVKVIENDIKQVAKQFFQEEMNITLNPKELNSIVKSVLENNYIKMINSNPININMRANRYDIGIMNEPIHEDMFFGVSDQSINLTGNQELSKSHPQDLFFKISLIHNSIGPEHFGHLANTLSFRDTLTRFYIEAVPLNKNNLIDDISNVDIQKMKKNAFELQVKIYIEYLSDLNMQSISDADIEKIKKNESKDFNCNKNGRIVDSTNTDTKENKNFSISTVSTVHVKNWSRNNNSSFLYWTSDDYKNYIDKTVKKKYSRSSENSIQLTDFLRFAVLQKTTQKLAKKMNLENFPNQYRDDVHQRIERIVY